MTPGASGDLLVLRAADRSRIVGQLAELGPDLLGVEPEDLRTQVVDRLHPVAGGPSQPVHSLISFAPTQQED